LAVAVALGGASDGLSESPAPPGPALPLPDPSPEAMAASNWPEGRELSNSIRAWHYNPQLVQPLLEVGSALDETPLSQAMRMMLATVVASRNGCFY
jgi:hypothetical protein